jgi:hypothetical protein
MIINRSHDHRIIRTTVGRSTLGLAALLVAGGLLTGCQGTATAAFQAPVTVVKAANGAAARLSLTALGAEQVGVATAAVAADPTVKGGLRLPYSALIYQPDGTTWVYTSPAKLVYVRSAVKVLRVDGDTMVVTSGPALGTLVVVTGAAELFGAEFDTEH